MSGRTKTIIYHIVDVTLWVAAAAGLVLMWYFSGQREIWIAAVDTALLLFLPLHIFVHELGHVLVGTLAGMRFFSFRVGNFTIAREKGKVRVRYASSNPTAGESGFCPKSPSRVRGRVVLTALGGAAFHLIYAAVFFTLYFILPAHPALLFFELYAPFSLYEGIMALYPAELAAGKTDGKVALGLLRGNAEELVALRVLTVQGILHRATFDKVPREILFDAPVVREDLHAYHALLLLRAEYLLSIGEEPAAKGELERLQGLSEYLSEEERTEVSRYLKYFEGDFTKGDEPLYGIRELEKQLEKQQKSSAKDRT